MTDFYNAYLRAHVASADEARHIADIHADLALQHSLESVTRCLPSDRDQRLERQEPWTVTGWQESGA